jgi:hypothetical protein
VRIGAGGKENHGGASSLVSWSEEESLRRRCGGRRRSRGKKKRITPAPLFISRDCGRGHGGSAPLPRPFLRASPHGGTSWGGCSYNRATRK